MNTAEVEQDPTLGDAMAALAQMETADAGTGAAVAEPAAASVEQEQHAAPADDKGVQPPKPGETGAPADTDSQKPPETKQPEQKPDDKGKYKRAIERGFTNWKEFSDWKAEQRKLIETDQSALKAEREELAKQRKAFEDERAKLQPKHKPEDYEGYADQLRKQAEQLEAAGQFEDAAEAKAKAKLAKQYAEELRKNPPKPTQTDEQAKAEYEKLEKEWYGKAGVDFPAASKQGTPENAKLQELLKVEPSLLKDPKAMYYGLRLATAETVAARVPKLEKELADAQAKVKELNEKLAVPADGAVHGAGEIGFEQKSEDQQFDELRQMANAIDRS